MLESITKNEKLATGRFEICIKRGQGRTLMTVESIMNMTIIMKLLYKRSFNFIQTK